MNFIAAIGEQPVSRDMPSEPASGRAFFVISALLFAVSARGDDRLVWLHVLNGRHADARRLDDVNGLDADA